jgi:hypothetical protein
MNNFKLTRASYSVVNGGPPALTDSDSGNSRIYDRFARVPGTSENLA